MISKVSSSLSVSVVLLAFALTACSGSGGSSGGPGPRGPGEFDFNVDINAAECHRDIIFNQDVQEALKEAIHWGEAPCVKKFLNMGAKANQKIKTGSPWDNDMTLPVHFALEDSSLFFANSGIGRQGFEVIKALTDGGADLNAKNERNETALQVALNSRITEKYAAVTKYIIQSKKADLEIKDTSGNTPLLLMLTSKNKDLVEFLLSHDANIQAKTLSGQSTLQLAVEDGFEDIAVALTNRDVNPSLVDRNGNNTLHRASSLGMAALVKTLLTKAIDVNKLNNEHETALVLATEKGANDIAKDLLAKGADSNIATNTESAIHIALRKNNDELSGIFIPLLNDVNVRDSSKNTPLILAARYASPAHVQALLARKADANLTDGEGYTALMRALSAGSSDKVTDLLPASNLAVLGPRGETALFFAKTVSDTELLLRSKADINQVSQFGETALSKALKSDNKEVSSYLISSGADVQWKDRQDQTSLLHIAIAREHLQAARALLMKGVSSNALDIRRESPLFFATSLAAVDLLVEFQANIQQLSSTGESALLTMTEVYTRGNFENSPYRPMIERLLQLGANPNVKTADSRTPLHFAVLTRSSSPAILTFVAALLEKKANVNVQDVLGNTPLHLVTEEEVAKTLLSANPNLTLKNRAGLTAKDVQLEKERNLRVELQTLALQIRDTETKLATLPSGSAAYKDTERYLNSLRQNETDKASQLSKVQRILALF